MDSYPSASGVRGLPLRGKAVLAVFALMVCSVFAFVVYAERAEAIQSTDYSRFPDAGLCVKEYSDFYYQSAYATHLGTANTRSLDYNYCYYARPKPAGHIASKAVVWVYAADRWQVCTDIGWKSSTAYTSSWTAIANVNRYGCGYNLAHGTMAQGAVWSYPSWRYSPSVWSSYQFTNRGTSAGQGKGTGSNDPSPRPSWVKADGTIDKSRMPDCVPVAGSDGEPVMKNGKPHCIPKDELLDKPDPNVRGKTPKQIDAINRKNAEEAEEALEGDSPNSLGDDDNEDPITEGKVIVK